MLDLDQIPKSQKVRLYSFGHSNTAMATVEGYLKVNPADKTYVAVETSDYSACVSFRREAITNAFLHEDDYFYIEVVG